MPRPGRPTVSIEGLNKRPSLDNQCYCTNDFTVPYNHTFRDHERTRHMKSMRNRKREK